MASLAVKGLTRSYRGTAAVKDLDLHIDDGKFFTLLGPSGCGKTTTLNAIAGIIDVDEGDIIIGDRLVLSKRKKIFIEPKDRNIAMLFQEFSIYPNMRVRESLALPLRAKKIEESAIKKRVEAVAKITGVDRLLDRRPSTLSGGEKRRAGLAKALVKKADIYLLDEPLTGCDAKMRVQLRGEIRRIHEDLGGTIVNVTHDQVEAMCMSDVIMLMNHGEKVQVGSPDDLYYRPNCVFTAGFIGSPPMNLIDCSVGRVDGKLSFVRPEFEFPAPPRMASKLKKYADKEVVIGIRPDGLSVEGPTNNALQGYSLKAKISYVETSQPNLLIHAKCQDLEIVIESEDLKGRIGSETAVRVNPKKIHVFSKETGRVIVNALHTM